MITYTIGRASDNDIVIEKDNISSYHAQLKYYDGNQAVIEDKDSANGVWVNGRRVHACLINDDDEVLLAGNEFKLDKYFRYYDGAILEPKAPNDYTDDFGKLVEIEEQYELELDNINKRSSKSMLFFRASLGVATLAGISLKLFEEPTFLYIAIALIVIALVSTIIFYSRAMTASRKKERLRKQAREDFKLSFCCHSCNNHIPDSTYVMKMKKMYNCRYCKALLYKTVVKGIRLGS